MSLPTQEKKGILQCSVCLADVPSSQIGRHIRGEHSFCRPSTCFPSLQWIDCPMPECLFSSRQAAQLLAHYTQEHPNDACINMTKHFPSALRCDDCGHWSSSQQNYNKHRSKKHQDTILHLPKVCTMNGNALTNIISCSLCSPWNMPVCLPILIPLRRLMCARFARPRSPR